MTKCDYLNRRRFFGTLTASASIAMNQNWQRCSQAEDALPSSIDSKERIAALTTRLNPRIDASRQAALELLKSLTDDF